MPGLLYTSVQLPHRCIFNTAHGTSQLTSIVSTGVRTSRFRDGRLHVAHHPYALHLEAQAPDFHLGEPRNCKAAILDQGITSTLIMPIRLLLTLE